MAVTPAERLVAPFPRSLAQLLFGWFSYTTKRWITRWEPEDRFQPLAIRACASVGPSGMFGQTVGFHRTQAAQMFSDPASLTLYLVAIGGGLLALIALLLSWSASPFRRALAGALLPLGPAALALAAWAVAQPPAVYWTLASL